VAFLLELLFWLSAGSIGFAYAGYPILTYCLGALFRRQIKLGERHNRPAVSFVLVVHNAREQIVRRLQNLLESSANPEDEIIVVCDGCSDDTVALAKSLHSPLVRVEQVPRGGKASGLNHGVSLASREIVIFCDARQSFEPGAADQLLRYFADSRTGAVSGNLSIAPSQSGAGRGVDVYWRLEKFIRRWESAFDSAIGCTGAFYAIRRSLYEPLPADTLLDDVVTPMRIAERGYRVLFAPEAIAWEPQRLDPANERRRKPRTLAGNYQMLFRYPHWSLPWRFRLWWQLWSHRYLRLLGVPLLATMFLSSSGLALHQPFYRFLFAGECGLLALALCGLAFPRISLRLVTIPSAFLLLQWTSVHGLFFYLRMLQQKNRPPGVTW
jgi:cellulose synthase/poly-beta-1,6-N-acetylglucosamine synthase-like glycosyltransferase